MNERAHAMQDEEPGDMYPDKPRAFISYAHYDGGLAERVAAHLETIGVHAMWDRNFAYGHGFHEQIRLFIAHAHVFLPIITEASSQRGWVHQEIGYAMALNVPVLPIAVGLPPGEMLRQLHAVQLPDKDTPIDRLLTREAFELLIARQDDDALALYACADESEDRAAMLYRYATDVRQMREADVVRQRGALTSFHIPDKTVGHQAWLDRYGGRSRGAHHCHLQRQERRALEWHARKKGARLIIQPDVTYEEYGPGARIARLEELLIFLDACDDRINVARGPWLREGENVTIVGDWFLAFSISGTPGRGYRQTIFTRHAPTIRRRTELFDQEFDENLERYPWPTANSTREGAIIFLRSRIAELRSALPP